MKVSIKKNPGGLLSPADEVAEEQLKALKNNEYYIADIKLYQNYRLHKKVWAFFNYCTQFYYGDKNVTRGQVELTRRKLTMFAGYVKQEFLPDGKRFELVPVSISYEKMNPEDRGVFYNNLVNAALEKVFHTADESEYNKLMGFF